jgi:hypothetical protein
MASMEISSWKKMALRSTSPSPGVTVAVVADGDRRAGDAA